VLVCMFQKEIEVIGMLFGTWKEIRSISFMLVLSSWNFIIVENQMKRAVMSGRGEEGG